MYPISYLKCRAMLFVYFINNAIVNKTNQKNTLYPVKIMIVLI